MTPTARRARDAALHRHAVDRLLTLYNETSQSERAEGRQWYPNALATAARIARPEHGISIRRAAAIIAVLSPQTRWRQNVAGAARLIDAAAAGTTPTGLPGYPTNHAKALNIAQGAAFGAGVGDAFGGEAPKVRAFYRNIVGGYIYSRCVTLDVWAMRAATGKDGPPPRGARYAKGEGWYQTAAVAVGERPCDFQAIIWLAMRPPAEHERDQEAAP